MFTHGTASHDPLAMDRQEVFVKRVYALVDQVIAQELDHLRNRKGLVPTCSSGCSHCCRHHILINVLEAHTLTRHIQREFSTQQIKDLKTRVDRWHAWDNTMPGRYPRSTVASRTDFSGYTHRCPLVVNDACSAYEARPLVCRLHYVSSPVTACCESAASGLPPTTPEVLMSIKTAAHSYALALKDHIEEKGLDYSRTVMLLPHWLSTEMDWTFHRSQR